LRTPASSDRKEMARLANNRNVWSNLRDVVPHPYYEEDAEDFIQLCRVEDPPYTFIIDYRGKMAGVIGLEPMRDVHRFTAEIGYWIGEPYWNRGIATVAVDLMTHYAFDQLEYKRLHAGVFELNKASMRVLEKCGYAFEGVFRKNVFKEGHFLDEYRYARINVEY